MFSPYQVVKKLIGNIEPYGDSNIDKERMKNLQEHYDVTESLVKDLIDVAKYRNRPEASIKELGNEAYLELIEIKNIIDRVIK